MNHAPTTATQESVLPYKDTKPQGAADFYMAINATFRYVEKKFGPEGLRAYWRELGQKYFAPVSAIWNSRGLPGVAQYWRDFFRAEPGSEVTVEEKNGRVEVNVRVCPAIAHLKKEKREIHPCFCQHCYFVSDAIGEKAGIAVRVEGGNGSCRQIFEPRTAATQPQDLSRIAGAK